MELPETVPGRRVSDVGMALRRRPPDALPCCDRGGRPDANVSFSDGALAGSRRR